MVFGGGSFGLGGARIQEASKWGVEAPGTFQNDKQWLGMTRSFLLGDPMLRGSEGDFHGLLMRLLGEFQAHLEPTHPVF